MAQTGQLHLHVAGTLADFQRAADDLRSALDLHGVDDRARAQAELIFEEIVTNVIRHGGAGGRPPRVDVAVDIGQDELILTFEDDGPPFDPLQRPDPVRPTSIEDATPGGLGIYLSRRSAADVRYERTGDGRNRLTVAVAAAGSRQRDSRSSG
jgi:serine/threonine-protein kinase RsbW